MADTVPWLSLPDAVWLRILHPPKLWQDLEDSYAVHRDHEAWLAHHGLLASLMATCRRLRDLVLSPAAAQLWTDVCIGRVVPSLERSKWPQLRAYVERHAHRARHLSVFDDLCETHNGNEQHAHAVVASAKNLRRIELFDLRVVASANVLTCALAHSNARLEAAGLYRCSAGPQLPSSVQELCISQPAFNNSGWDWLQQQAELQGEPALVSWILHG